MKITGMMLDSSSTSGSRMVCSRLRRVITAMSLMVRVSGRCRAVVALIGSRSRVAGGRGLTRPRRPIVCRGVVGQREEHVVKGRLAQGHVLRGDPGAVQATQRIG